MYLKEITTITVGAVILGAMLFTFKSCSDANDRFYASQKHCVENGGSWITIESFKAHCITGRK